MSDHGHSHEHAGDHAPKTKVYLIVAFIPFGLWAFGRAERYAKRTGKLKRVG